MYLDNDMIELINISQHNPPGHTRLHTCSLRVNKGQFAYIQGNSASGKTLLFKLITGIIPATAGHIVINGHRLSQQPRRNHTVRRALGLIPQRPFIMPHDCVFDNIALALTGSNLSHPTINQRVDAAIEATQLSDCSHYKDCLNLTPSQIQRIQIARALITTPCAIIADEPFYHLSDQHRQHILALFGRLARTNIAIIVMGQRACQPDECLSFKLTHGHLVDQSAVHD